MQLKGWVEALRRHHHRCTAAFRCCTWRLPSRCRRCSSLTILPGAQCTPWVPQEAVRAANPFPKPYAWIGALPGCSYWPAEWRYVKVMPRAREELVTWRG